MFTQTSLNRRLAIACYPVLEITATVEPFDNGRSFSLRVLRAGKLWAPRPSHDILMFIFLQDSSIRREWPSPVPADTLSMNLVEADVIRLKFPFTMLRWSLLTSAATVQRANGRNFDSGDSLPAGAREREGENRYPRTAHGPLKFSDSTLAKRSAGG